jgi:hypothetical protein
LLLLGYWGLNTWTISWTTPPALLYEDFFPDKFSQTVYPGQFQTTVLLISASCIARITGMSHGHPTFLAFLYSNILLIHSLCPLGWGSNYSYVNCFLLYYFIYY